MQIVRTIKEFNIKIHNSSKIIIYGAGWAGRTVSKFLKNHHIPASAFAVTAQEHAEEQDGVPVYSLDDILRSDQPEELVFVLGVTDIYRHALEIELERRGVHTYIICLEVLFYDMARQNRRFAAREAEIRKEKRNGGITVGYLMPGYFDLGYAEQRLIIGQIEGVSYLPIPKETAETARSLEYEDKPLFYRELEEACYYPDQYIPDVDLIHVFNMVCDMDKPWCASFETQLPKFLPRIEREKKYYLQLVEAMKRPNCKSLYALCKSTYEIQKYILSLYIPQEEVDLLMNKTKILHPPQEILISNKEFIQKHNTQRIHFIFIGRCFFFKGGREVIETLSEFEGRYDFDLTLISSLIYNDYFTKTPYEEMRRCRRLIQESSWIDYYETLPNQKVIEKCKEATIGLLPSVADTYGYAVLEMQAAGCPVVTTNIRAFPEIIRQSGRKF